MNGYAGILFGHSAIVERVCKGETPAYRPVNAQDVEETDMHPSLALVLKQSWAEQPADRPTFEHIAKVIRSVNSGK